MLIYAFFPFESFRLRSYSLQFYEWVEDEIADNGSILGSDGREQAQILISEDFGKYKKFEKLSRRMKKLLRLKVIGNAGKEKRWVSATENMSLSKQVVVTTQSH